ncbi:unnamed protein product [Triticum turgidum subsp. durum]|uniref:Uncharacterized protein n=1 Tax=Triticum turgidum subsp. durum TaxID=4567 RepID=A0A9R0QLS1_TRITD|nr:unnamed protein product [Triticum turgidum subsp. durum]
MLLVPPSEWEGERGVSGEPDGARGVDEMPPALPSGREEERGVGDEAGVGGEMVSDGRDEVGSLGVERAFVEVFARALFYPTVMLNYGHSLIEPEFHWWDRIDKLSSRLYSSSSFTGRILRENSKGRLMDHPGNDFEGIMPATLMAMDYGMAN